MEWKAAQREIEMSDTEVQGPFWAKSRQILMGLWQRGCAGSADDCSNNLFLVIHVCDLCLTLHTRTQIAQIQRVAIFSP